MADLMARQIALTKHMYELQRQVTAIAHHSIGETKEMAVIVDELRGHISDFEDLWRPIRSYFYWEKHCYDIPICFSLRSIFDLLDGVDLLTDKLHDLLKDLDKLDVLLPQLLQQLPPLIAISESMRTMTADDAQHHVRDLQRDGRNEPERKRHGAGVRCGKERRFLLSASGGFPEPGLPAGDEFLPVSRRESGSIHHFASGRSRDARGHSAYRSDKDGGRGGAQDDTPGGRQDLYRRHRVDLQGLSRRLQIRSVDRGRWCALPYLYHHARPHAKLCCGPGYRGYGGAFVGRIVRAVGADLAICSGRQIALDGASDVGDHPFGGGI